MRRVIRLLLPPVVVGVLIALSGVALHYADGGYGDTGGVVFLIGLAIAALGLVAVAVYGAVCFVRWAIR